MQLTKIPRGREGNRSIHAAPVPDPNASAALRFRPYATYDGRRDGLAIRTSRGEEMKARRVHDLKAHAPTDDEIKAWIGSRATDEFGKSVGKVEDVYKVGDSIEWLLIRHRRSHHFLAPVRDAVGTQGSVFLPYTADVIESAPGVQPGRMAEEETLATAAEHYGLKR